MALGAVGAITREANLIEAKYAPGSVNREISCQFFSGVNPVNHESEVDGLGQRIERTAERRRYKLRDVHSCRVMAELAVLGSVQPPAAVEGHLLMTHVAVLRTDNLPPGDGHFVRNRDIGHRVGRRRGHIG